MTLKEQIKTAPLAPGIYWWLDKKQTVLYVGRAINLRRRLTQYLQKNIDSRIKEMVNQAQTIKFTETDNLLEAIILEAQTIKKYWPKYNIKDRDNRSFIYIVIPKVDFARPLIIRERELNKFTPQAAHIFGPYQSQALIQNALRVIRRIFPYSTCKPHSSQACFDYQIGLCPGACLDIITAKEYKNNINHIVLLLSGQKQKLFKKLFKKYPDKIRALKHLQDVALLTREDDLTLKTSQRLEGYDISHLTGKETYGSMVVFTNGQPNKKEYRLFKIQTAPAGDDERALAEMLERRFKHQDWPQPDLIMIDGGRPQIKFLETIFQKQKIFIPMVGISKFGGDKLVYTTKSTKNFRELIINLKPILLQLREEAHRFGLRASRRARKLK